MDAKKCDRCNKYYEPYRQCDEHMTRTGEVYHNVLFNGIILRSNSEYIKNIDLCKECAKSVYEWLTKKEV